MAISIHKGENKMNTFDISPEKFAPIPKANKLVVPDGCQTYVRDYKLYNLYKDTNFCINDIYIVDPDGKKTRDICGYALYVNGNLVGTYNQKKDYYFAGQKSDMYIKLPVDTIKFVIFQKLVAQEKLKKAKTEKQIKELEDEISFYNDALTKGYEFPKTTKNLALAETYNKLSEKYNAQNKTPKLKTQANLLSRLKHTALCVIKTYAEELKFCMTATKTKFRAKKYIKKMNKERKIDKELTL